MQLPLITKIAGKKTVNDWNIIRAQLSDFKNANAWENAFNVFFIKRLDERYFKPIEAIKSGIKDDAGKGFAIIAIICSIIEFLETTFEGLNYNHCIKRGIVNYEYGDGRCQTNIVGFLTSREPFLNFYTKAIALDFYFKVRCGLLHEARTTGNWKIRRNSKAGCSILQTASENIIFYDKFLLEIFNSINEYKKQLLIKDSVKEAFIRKFDALCTE